MSALDPAVAAAKQQLADEAENAHLIHNGEPTSSPPVPAEVLVQCRCSLAFIARPDADLIGQECEGDHGAKSTIVHSCNSRTCPSCTSKLLSSLILAVHMSADAAQSAKRMVFAAEVEGSQDRGAGVCE